MPSELVICPRCDSMWEVCYLCDLSRRVPAALAVEYVLMVRVPPLSGYGGLDTDDLMDLRARHEA